MSIYLISVCFVISLFCMGFLVTPWALSFIFVFFFVDGFYYPVLDDLINKRIPSGKRATIISLGSALSCLMSCAVNPVLGQIADIFSLQTTFKVLGLGVLICLSLVLALLDGRGGLASGRVAAGGLLPGRRAG